MQPTIQITQFSYSLNLNVTENQLSKPQDVKCY